MATEKEHKRKLNSHPLGQSVNLIRMIAAIFIISSIVLQSVYNRYLPDFNEPPAARWALTIIVSIFLLFTFIIKFTSIKQLDYFSITLYVIVQSYTVFLTIINQFNPFAITLLILVMGGGTVIITNSFFYWIQSALLFLLIGIQFVNVEFNDVMVAGLFNIIVSVLLFGAVLFIRLKMVREVSFSNSLLKKVHLFSIIANPSGQIVFVTSSVKAILGYDSKTLLKEGWWENKNISSSWIEKEYILNYPGAIPPEIKSIESSAVSSEGNTVWLSWTTSILPDGNYMGVALDITKYKIVD